MTHPRDFVNLKLTEEEYREIFRYTELHLGYEWVKEHEDGSFGQTIDPDDLNPNFIGMLGECALGKAEGKPVTQTLAERPIRQSDAGWDIIIGGLKYDIKVLRSFKGRRPTLDFRYNITRKLITQNKPNDGYFWISMIKYPALRAMPWYWLAIGWMLKEEFLEKADFHRTGDKSVTGNNFVFSSPTYDIPVRKLHPYKDIPR